MKTASLRWLLASLAALTLLATACGGSNEAADFGGLPIAEDNVGDAPPAAGACLAGEPDCQDMGPLPVGEEQPDEVPPSTGMCAPDMPDCQDVIVSDGTSSDPGDSAEYGDSFDSEQARAEARELLGTPEDELPEDVRVGRRGDEQLMLTEDYVLGRNTVELDDRPDDDLDQFVVTAVTVELPEGPETFTLDG